MDCVGYGGIFTGDGGEGEAKGGWYEGIFTGDGGEGEAKGGW